jgi:hypothetical protein
MGIKNIYPYWFSGVGFTIPKQQRNMKTKKITSLVLGLLLAIGLNAQEFNFGITAGFDIANARLTNKPSSYGAYRTYYPLTAFNINAHFGFKSNSFWAITTEPGFIQKGGVIRYDDNYRDKDAKLISNYIQFPVLIDFYLTKKLSLSIGPEFAYMIGTKAKSKENSKDITDLYDNKFEISGLIGINYSVFKYIDLGLLYNHGLTYTQIISFTDDTGTKVGEGKVYNQYFQLFVRFKIKARSRKGA